MRFLNLVSKVRFLPGARFRRHRSVSCFGRCLTFWRASSSRDSIPLDEEQRAVESGDVAIAVLAGPGSGKRAEVGTRIVAGLVEFVPN
jgi:hypothetical protein